MTERLYYNDAYLARFQARVVERGCDPCELYLDRTAFYPTSGGQPFDTGKINDVPVVDVIEDGDRIQHRLTRPVNVNDVACTINWERRFDHMQQHSGQHLLSAVLMELYSAPTVGFHLGRDGSTIDVSAAILSSEQIRQAEERANEVVFENRHVTVAFEHSSEAQDLRKPPEREGILRIVSINGLDRSACGGTHVASTGEIGPILIRKIDKAHGNMRIEFLCGRRAAGRARADYDALAQIALIFSSPLEEVPSLVASQQSRLVNTEKALKRLTSELAQARGGELYHQTHPDQRGFRRLIRQIQKGPIGDDLRAEARSFTANPKAVFTVLIDEPPSALLAVSEDTGIHAGNTLSKGLAEVKGRGGGNAHIAQGSLPSRETLRQLQTYLEEQP